MNYFMLLVKSPVFWTALIGVISAVVMQYTGVPKEVWIPIESLLAAVAVIFTGAEVGQHIGRSAVITMRELDKKRQISLEDKG